jgi:polyferredoxin
MAAQATPVRRPRARRAMSKTQIARRTVQVGFLLFIVFASLRHTLFEETTTSASIDALCPFGAVETFWTAWTTGQFIPKTHPSNLVLGLAVIVATLAAGAAFCGWMCPFGTLQDGLTWLRNRLRIRELRVPQRLDRVLRYGRYVMLALVLYMTISSVRLWFADYDPYRTLFGLGWLFEFNLAENWIAYSIALAILVGSFFVPRFWCKYACPLGGLLSLFNNVSLLRIRRTESTCKSCALCNRPCPMGIDVAAANPFVSANCINCLECVDTCPRHGALEVNFAPSVWWQGLRRRFSRPAAVREGDSA